MRIRTILLVFFPLGILAQHNTQSFYPTHFHQIDKYCSITKIDTLIIIEEDDFYDFLVPLEIIETHNYELNDGKGIIYYNDEVEQSDNLKKCFQVNLNSSEETNYIRKANSSYEYYLRYDPRKRQKVKTKKIEVDYTDIRIIINEELYEKQTIPTQIELDIDDLVIHKYAEEIVCPRYLIGSTLENICQAMLEMDFTDNCSKRQFKNDLEFDLYDLQDFLNLDDLFIYKQTIDFLGVEVK